jgi:effector-binding domain-containing protein
MEKDTVTKPVMIIEKTKVDSMQVLLISDTGNTQDLSKLFENDYTELFKFVFANNLIPGTPMAFHLNITDPMRVEIAVPVNKIPPVLTGRINSKTLEGGNAVVLHYIGPYDEMGTAYNRLHEWIKTNNIQPLDISFEVYLNDPASAKSKYELKTDIYLMVR